MAIIKLTIAVANLTNVMSLFDEIQVWRSEDGENGTYFEITGSAAAAATILGTETSSFTLNGLTLKLEVDGGSEQTVTFVSADPINVDDTVEFINDNVTGVTATEDAGAVRLSSDTTGTSSTLEITGGTALTELGFVQDDKDNGEDSRITLSAGVETYYFDDQSGDPEFYYKVRYYNSSTDAVSDYGPASKGDVGSVLPSSDLIKAIVKLTGMDGKPVTDRKVVFFNKYVPPLVISEYLMADREITVITDQVGYAETMLVKGSEVVVTIAGTSIVRHITVPTSGTDFSVSDAIAAADDLFQIQVPDIPAAVRRTL